MALHNNCQCEHEKHTNYPPTGHPYGITFVQVVQVNTTMGKFWVCPKCAQECYGPNSGVRKDA